MGKWQTGTLRVTTPSAQSLYQQSSPPQLQGSGGLQYRPVWDWDVCFKLHLHSIKELSQWGNKRHKKYIELILYFRYWSRLLPNLQGASFFTSTSAFCITGKIFVCYQSIKFSDIHVPLSIGMPKDYDYHDLLWRPCSLCPIIIIMIKCFTTFWYDEAVRIIHWFYWW